MTEACLRPSEIREFRALGQQVDPEDRADRAKADGHHLPGRKGGRQERAFDPEPIDQRVAGDGLASGLARGRVARQGFDQALQGVAVCKIAGLVHRQKVGVAADLVHVACPEHDRPGI